jgi:class 3 adenylate cyclase
VQVTELPRGTVTFLTTDVEGSTRLLDTHGAAAVAALDRHEILIREVVQAHAGAIFSAHGDGFGCAFADPLKAAEAALEAQRRQQLDADAAIGPLKVRMALHSAPDEPHRGDYRSAHVNRAFRLAGIARGGQVLVSQATRDLLGGAMVAGASLRPLGEYRLKDLAQSEQVFQLVAPGLSDFSYLDRVLLTILFTDIVGSTAAAVQLGDRSWRSLIASHHELLRENLPRFNGREIRSTGDGLCAVFNTPTRAIECAMAMCDAVGGLGMQIRVGIHTGECEFVGDTLEGLAVHIAARVSAYAGPGEVLVSRTVTELVAGSGIAFAERGAQIFKGVPGEWHVLQVRRG